jgi:hypothetical protein
MALQLDFGTEGGTLNLVFENLSSGSRSTYPQCHTSKVKMSSLLKWVLSTPASQ